MKIKLTPKACAQRGLFMWRDLLKFPAPVTTDDMRSWDRAEPENRLVPRPEQLPNPQLSRPVRGVSPAKISRANATFTTDAISGNLRLI